MACADDFMQTQLAEIEAQITAMNAMFATFTANGGLQEYELNTGQSEQRVKRSDLSQMRLAYDSLYNRYVTLWARLGCGGVLIVRPSF